MATRNASTSFQKCQAAQYETGAAQKEQPENPSFLLKKFFAFECTARFLEAHNAAITAVATVLLTFVTGGLVWTGYQQIRTTRAQLRAYVSVEPGNSLVQGGRKNFKFEMFPTIVNVGETPAYNVKASSRIDLLPYPIPANFDFNVPAFDQEGSRTTLGAKQDRFTNVMLDRKLSLRELRELRLGASWRLCVWGAIEYEDIFGRTHRTNYCYALLYNRRRNPVWHNTARHNDST